jgi:hypothetical protein
MELWKICRDGVKGGYCRPMELVKDQYDVVVEEMDSLYEP